MTLAEPVPVLDLSIVLDMETAKITRKLLFGDRFRLWLEAARRVAPHTFELLVCSNQPLEGTVEFPESTRLIHAPGLGYYGMKSLGGRQARGKIISWCDIDCRPEPDYFFNLLRHFATGTDRVLGGRTFYDGTDFATRVNSALSWGHLHGVETLGPGDAFVGHNVAMRAGALPGYFDPYTERYGGDEHITSRFREAGDPLRVKADLIIHHESAAHSLRGLLDRQFREIGRAAYLASPSGKVSPRTMLAAARKRRRDRWYLFKRHAHKFDIARREWWKARLLLGYYNVLCHFAVGAMIVRPSVLAKWLAYQFGDLEKCRPVQEGPGDGREQAQSGNHALHRA